MPTLNDEIHAVLRAMTAAWNALDFEALAALWNGADDALYYLAEEAREPLLDWQSLCGYWRETRRVTRALSMRISDVRARCLAQDLTVATWQMHWNAEVMGFERPIGGDNRVSAILRRSPSGWRFIHYVEAPLAPLAYLRRHYERDVDPEFVHARAAAHDNGSRKIS